MFNIGDKVIIVDKGQVYTTFTEKAKELNAHLSKWAYNESPKEGDKFTILNMSYDGDYILINNDSSQFVMAPEGIELCKGTKDMSKSVFYYKFQSKASLKTAMLFLKDLGYKLSSADLTVEANTEEVYKYCLSYLVVEKNTKQTNACNVASDGETVITSLDELIELVSCSNYKKEYIDAMKETAIEYIQGTHVRSYTECKLCILTANIKGIPVKDFYATLDKCSTCPWVILTGEVCSYKDPSERAKELIDWVEQYKKM